MPEMMTSKERFLIAMTGGMPDRVPCTPDISNMVPCRLTGRPFWDIYLHNRPPIWRAYLDAADHFGIDAWFSNGRLDFESSGGVERETISTTRQNGRIVRRTRIATPDGELFTERTYYSDNSPTATEKPVKNLRDQFHLARYLYQTPLRYRTDTAEQQRALVGERHAFGTSVGIPGFHAWFGLCDGGVAPLAYAAADQPELLDALRDLHERMTLKQLEMIIDSKLFDYVLIGASGAVTLAGTAMFDRYAFPTLKTITRTCREAGLPTMLHCCGMEHHLVKRCATETDLDCVNPLEPPPMGDCELAELKTRYGGRLALMGNLHTTDVMLHGSVDTVRQEARRAIDDAAAGGGFILSTGDQCGRDTPDENLFALVETAKTYGRY